MCLTLFRFRPLPVLRDAEMKLRQPRNVIYYFKMRERCVNIKQMSQRKIIGDSYLTHLCFFLSFRFYQIYYYYFAVVFTALTLLVIQGLRGKTNSIW